MVQVDQFVGKSGRVGFGRRSVFEQVPWFAIQTGEIVPLDQNSVVYLPYKDPLCSSSYSRSDFSWSVLVRQDQNMLWPRPWI